MRKLLTLVGILVSLALGLVACGANAGASTNLSVNMTEFTFNPATFTVPAGKEITLNLNNIGAVEHEFIIMEQGAQVGEDFGDEDMPNIYWQAKQGPGTSGAYTFTAPSQPGEYQVVCGTPGHYMAGMVGKLVVVAP